VSKNGLMPSTMLGITVGENNLKDYVVVKHNWNNRLLIPKVSQTVDGLMSV
jgi:hypothetical protein